MEDKSILFIRELRRKMNKYDVRLMELGKEDEIIGDMELSLQGEQRAYYFLNEDIETCIRAETLEEESKYGNGKFLQELIDVLNKYEIGILNQANGKTHFISGDAEIKIELSEDINDEILEE